jgi:hypothetical protein
MDWPGRLFFIEGACRLTALKIVRVSVGSTLGPRLVGLDGILYTPSVISGRGEFIGVQVDCI